MCVCELVCVFVCVCLHVREWAVLPSSRNYFRAVTLSDAHVCGPLVDPCVCAQGPVMSHAVRASFCPMHMCVVLSLIHVCVRGVLS